MSKICLVAALIALSTAFAAQAAETKPLVLPKVPAPVKQTLPLDAQPTPNGVYVPTSKSGNFGVTIEKLKSPAPGEMGAKATATIKVP
jgi:hypothetical protein